MSNDSLTEEQKLANILFGLYQGLDRAYGRYTVMRDGATGEKTKGRATTELSRYKADLWVGHLHGAAGLGVIPIMDDGNCWWGSIDIDKYDIDLIALEKQVRELNLPLIVLRTKSGGAHLTCFFSEPVPCKLVRRKLYEFSIALGHGGVEIFPKQTMLASKHDVGNWLNMPYFEYRNTTRYAIYKGSILNIVQFIDLATQIKINESTLTNIEVKMPGAFDDGPPCLQLIVKNGKVPEGARNSTLFAIGVYCRKKWEDEWADKVEEMNSEFVDPPLKSREVQTIVRSLGRKEYFYPCTKTPLREHCNKDLCKKRSFGIGEIEEDFNLSLGALCKIATEPPIWVIDVEGVRIQLDTEEILDQNKFRRACMISINRLPPLMKRSAWEKMIREKLENVEIIEAPLETRVNTRVNQYVHQYLINTPEGDSKEELLVGRPYHDRETGLIFFRGNDLIRFLNNNGLNFEPRKIWSALRDSGTKHKQINVGGAVTQVWFVSAKDMQPEDLPEHHFAKEAF